MWHLFHSDVAFQKRKPDKTQASLRSLHESGEESTYSTIRCNSAAVLFGWNYCQIFLRVVFEIQWSDCAGVQICPISEKTDEHRHHHRCTISIIGPLTNSSNHHHFHQFYLNVTLQCLQVELSSTRVTWLKLYRGDCLGCLSITSSHRNHITTIP